MVLPVTTRNRFVNAKYSSLYGGLYDYRSSQFGYTQVKPIDRVLPYTRDIGDVLKVKRDEINVGDAGSVSHPPAGILQPVVAAVKNLSYERMRSQMNTAAVGVNIVEYRQARDMLGTRGGQFLGIVSLLIRGKFASAGRALGCSFFNGKPPRKGRSKWVLPDYARKTNISLSNLWLEWHFGVDPMISDCQDAAKVLTEPIPTSRIRGSAREYIPTKIQTVYDNANPGTYYSDVWASRVSFRQGADVAITNPNLALANQLGLLNPATLLWEIIPFSFVADWFVNVGDWLQGFSDFAGMTLANAYNTSHIWSFHDYTQVSKPWGTGITRTGFRGGKRITVTRSVGITGVTLALRPLKLPSMSRVATTWSLLSQLVSRHR